MDIKIIERIEKSFPRIASLWIGIIAIIILLIPIDILFGKAIQNVMSQTLLYFIIVIIYVFIWKYFREKLPRKQRDKIGFIISIETENDKQRLRVKNDFVSHLKKLLIENNISDAFHIILLNDFQTEIVNEILTSHTEVLNRMRKYDYKVSKRDTKIINMWEKIRKKTEGNFWVWGQIKERQELNNKYFFSLDARVTHAPIPENENNPVKKAFGDSWFKKISVDEKTELIGFEFTAELVYIGVNYVSGIAAFISKDPFTAYKLHGNLLMELLKRFKPLPPNYKLLNSNLLEFLSMESAVISRFYMEQNNIPKAKEYLDSVFKYFENNYDGYLLKSIYEFKYKNDAQSALATIRQAAKLGKHHGAWRYNKAFLLLYLKKYDEALKTYFEIENYKYEGEEITIEQVVQFNKDRLEIEDDDIVSNFVLGFVYLKKLKNYPTSLEYFEKIIASYSEDAENDLILRKVNEYLKEIKREMKIP